MINTYIRSNEKNKTEDGDYICVKHFEVDTIAEAREVSKDYYDLTWTGKGGKMVASYEYVVDAAEVAIERSNDYWASMRDMGAPSWAL